MVEQAWLLLLVVTLSSLMASLSILAWGLLRRPRIVEIPEGDVLILAAHQDDAVIMAGELGIEARRRGGRVRVAFLTCGACEPGSRIAEIRRSEALDAWNHAGLSPTDLVFLDYPEALDPNSGNHLTSETMREASSRIEALIRVLGANATVVFPAFGESHVDHATVRELALRAAIVAGRADLQLIEAQEYHDYYSLMMGPIRGLKELVSCLPVFCRFSPLRRVVPPCGFVQAGAAGVLAPNECRLNTKREMLRRFESQDGDFIVEQFGRVDSLRHVPDPKLALSSDSGLYCGAWGASMLLAWIGIVALTVSIAWFAVRLVRQLFDQEGASLVLAISLVFISASLIVAGRRRQIGWPKRLLVWGMALGIACGALEIV